MAKATAVERGELAVPGAEMAHWDTDAARERQRFMHDHLRASLALEAAKHGVLSSEQAGVVIRQFLGLDG